MKNFLKAIFYFAVIFLAYQNINCMKVIFRKCDVFYTITNEQVLEVQKNSLLEKNCLNIVKKMCPLIEIDSEKLTLFHFHGVYKSLVLSYSAENKDIVVIGLSAIALLLKAVSIQEEALLLTTSLQSEFDGIVNADDFDLTLERSISISNLALQAVNLINSALNEKILLKIQDDQVVNIELLFPNNDLVQTIYSFHFGLSSIYSNDFLIKISLPKIVAYYKEEFRNRYGQWFSLKNLRQAVLENVQKLLSSAAYGNERERNLGSNLDILKDAINFLSVDDSLKTLCARFIIKNKITESLS